MTPVRDKAQPYAQQYEPCPANLRYTEQENLAEYDYANLTPLKAESAHHISTVPESEREKSCDIVLLAWEKMGGEISVKNVCQPNIDAREHNHCCQRDAIMRSVCTVVELRLSVNNITPLSVSTETQERCRAASVIPLIVHVTHFYYYKNI